MRALVVPAVLVVGWSLACPSGRTTGEGEGEGENEEPVGAATCDVNGVTLPVDVAADPPVLLGGGSPNVSCVGTPRVVSASTPVTLEGCVDIFGVGNEASRGITVSVFEEGVNPKTGTPLATGQVFVRNDASALDCVGLDVDAPACRAFDCDSEGFYRMDGTVPTHTPLTMRIAADNNTNVIDTYLWGLVFFDTQADENDVVNYEAALIFQSTWASIPTLSGRQITGGQTVGDGQGNAVVAGEVHDCDDVIIENAIVGLDTFDPDTMTIAYFNGEADPKPDLRRLTTASDGLYGILNVGTAAGANEHTVVGGYSTACDGTDCTCQSLSARTILTFPDSVSIVTLRGDFPVIQ